MKTRVAERLLSSVLSPERAASTVGDLLEGAAQRGNVWFWSGVLRTLAARIWNDFADQPVRLTNLGLRGFAMNVPFPIAQVILIDSLFRAHHFQTPDSYPVSLSWQLGFLAFHILWAASLFQTGRWSAGRAPGREIAACAVLSALGWAAVFLCYRDIRPVIVFLQLGLIHDLILLAGALSKRRQATRSAVQ